MKKKTIDPELKQLIKSKGTLAASVIIPLNPVPTGNSPDRLEISHAVSRLQQILKDMNHPESALTEKIGALAEGVKDLRGSEGVGLFASDTVSMMVPFPFEVQEKIVVNDSFEVRDLVRREWYSQDYFVLSANAGGCRLYRGSLNKLTEIKDQRFPALINAGQMEIPAPVQQGNNAGKAAAHDTAITTNDPGKYYKTIEERVSIYLESTHPLFVAGVEKELGYLDASFAAGLIKGKITGSFENYNYNDLEQKAWQSMKVYLKLRERETLHRFSEMGREFITSGIRDVWFDAKQGKGNILLVEKNYEQQGFLESDESRLFIEPTAGTKRQLQDAVDDIIELMIERNGEVLFVDNGTLKDHGGIAMMNRY